MKKVKSNKNQLGNPLAIAKVASKVGSAIQATKTTAKQYPGFFTLLGIGVLSLMGYSLVKKMRADNQGRIQDQKESEFSDNLTTTNQTDHSGISFNPSEIASRYKQAIYGVGTSEQEIMNLARISKGDRWPSISSQYKYLTSNPLLSDLQGELSTDEYGTFMNILKSPTWFAIGEYVYPKRSSVKALNNTNQIIDANVYWNIGSLGKVTNVKRTTYGGKQQEFYQTEDYPDYWVLVSELITNYNRIG